MIFLKQDLDKEEKIPLKQVGIEEILEAQRVEQESKQATDKIRAKRLKELGLPANVVDFTHDDAF